MYFHMNNIHILSLSLLVLWYLWLRMFSRLSKSGPEIELGNETREGRQRGHSREATFWSERSLFLQCKPKQQTSNGVSYKCGCNILRLEDSFVL